MRRTPLARVALCAVRAAAVRRTPLARVALCLVLLAGCSHASPAASSKQTAPLAPSTSPPATLPASPTADPAATAPPTRSAPPTPKPTPTAGPRPTRTPSPAAKAVATRSAAPVRRTSAPVSTAPTCPRVSGVGSATQVLLVVGSGSAATVRACQKRSGSWVSVLGTMNGHVGRNGVAPAGAKREGDGRTPSGVYSLGRGFGQRSNPGVSFSWRVVDSRDVWVDDAGSSLYNTWQRTPSNGRWDSAEPLDVSAYAYAQVVDYNTARTPARGSAIFLHVDLGQATSGCIALPRTSLLRVLRWERPGARILIR